MAMDMDTGMVGMTMIGMIMGPGGSTVVVGVVVRIRVTECLWDQVMVITLIPTSATPQGTAGIHAPIITMAIRIFATPRRALSQLDPLGAIKPRADGPRPALP
jgi:hypothetical protein